MLPLRQKNAVTGGGVGAITAVFVDPENFSPIAGAAAAEGLHARTCRATADLPILQQARTELATS